MDKISEHLDFLIKTWEKDPEIPCFPEIPDKLWPFYKEKNKILDTKNFIIQNKKYEILTRIYLKSNKIRRFTSKRRVMQILSQKNREIFIQNIPKLLKQTNFSRSELHSTFILYKVLQDVTSQQYPHYGLFFHHLFQKFFIFFKNSSFLSKILHFFQKFFIFFKNSSFFQKFFIFFKNSSLILLNRHKKRLEL